jgi:glycerophosphoryl diester phosphodiesterase
MKRILQALDHLRQVWQPVLFFAVLWAAVQIVMLAPVVSWGLGHLVRGDGQRAVSNQDIAGFLASPAGISFVILTTVSWAVLQMGQLSGYQLLAQNASRGLRLSPSAALRRVMRKLPRLAGLAAAILLRLAFIFLPVLGLLVLLYVSLPGGHDINYYLDTNPPEWRRTLVLAGIVLFLAVMVAAWLLLRWMLALPHVVATGGSATSCMKHSWEQTKGRVWMLAMPLLLWWALWTAASMTFTALLGFVAGSLLDFSAGRLEQTAVFLIIVNATGIIVGTAFSALGLAVSQFITEGIYRDACHPGTAFDKAGDNTLPDANPVGRRWLIAGLGATLLVSLITTVRHSRSLDVDVTVKITAHRGSSRLAPENSLSALRQAIADGADYAEIDVQTTRDGHIILWHDADLMRAIRDPRKVWDCTLEELRVPDVGSYFSPAFASERIATLEEAVAVAGDRIRLNVELKYNRPDPQLAVLVAGVLREKNWLHRCVVTSLEAAELRRFREHAPEVPVGLNVGMSIGSVARLPYDFLSVNTRLATPDLMSRTRRQGKTLHVWTVNQRETALRLIHLGVENLITDDPALLVALRNELQALDEVELLALALRQRFAW